MADEKVTLHNPEGLCEPLGSSQAASGQGRLVALAGQVGCDREARIVSSDLVEQFRQALENVATDLEALGGRPADLMKVNIYVRDMVAYKERIEEIGKTYREAFGGHYPPVTLVEVCRLFDARALVEVDAWAIL
jgi:enamine deaminase RidA (YjgF/YER057c/UK114 family)